MRRGGASAASEGSDADARHRQHRRPGGHGLAVVALLIALVVVGLLVLVLVGIHHEERHMSLTSAPRTRSGR